MGNISKKFFCFCWSGNASILPSFLRDCFPGYKNLDCLFFFLQHVKYMIPQHSGLTCSDETSVLILIGPLMHTMSLCSCCFEDFFPLSLGSFNIMCFCVDLDLSFLDLQSNVYFTLFHVKYFILFTMFYFTSLTLESFGPSFP